MSIGKMIIGVMMASFLGIVFTPEMMVASNSVTVMRMDDSNAVETVVSEVAVVETATDTTPVVTEVASPAKAEAMQPAPTATPVTTPVYTAPTNKIQILGNTVELAHTNATTEDAGAATLGWYYGDGQFIYAHNYTYVFGVMDTAYDNGSIVGAPITVTMDGVTRNYTVTGAQVYSKTAASWKMGSFLKADGHALAIMTCYGPNSESRLVVFAD